MKAHDLAKELLKSENLEVTVSIDAGVDDERVFGNNCIGVNSFKGDCGVITILFDEV